MNQIKAAQRAKNASPKKDKASRECASIAVSEKSTTETSSVRLVGIHRTTRRNVRPRFAAKKCTIISTASSATSSRIFGYEKQRRILAIPVAVPKSQIKAQSATTAGRRDPKYGDARVATTK